VTEEIHKKTADPSFFSYKKTGEICDILF